MSDFLVERLGWPALVIQGDPLVIERWKWLRRRYPCALKSGFRTLDAGCGNGAFAIWAATVGGDVVGLSDAGDDLRKAQARAQALGLPNVRFEAYDLRRLATDGARLGVFDAILCLEVIEHVLDDAGLLRSLAASLRPGASLFLTSPSADHRPLFGELEHQTTVEDGRHVRWGYDEAGLRTILASAGLEVVEFSRFGGYLTQRACGALWRLSAVSLPFAWAVTLPLRVVTFVDDWVTARLGLPFMSVGVVARKPAPSG